MTFTETFLAEARQVLDRLDHSSIEHMTEILAGVARRQGRLFILGVGGSAAGPRSIPNSASTSDWSASPSLAMVRRRSR